jgi:hypothetical protein
MINQRGALHAGLAVAQRKPPCLFQDGRGHLIADLLVGARFGFAVGAHPSEFQFEGAMVCTTLSFGFRPMALCMSNQLRSSARSFFRRLVSLSGGAVQGPVSNPDPIERGHRRDCS